MSQEPWKTDKWFVSPWNFNEAVRAEFHFPKQIVIHDITLREGEQQTGGKQARVAPVDRPLCRAIRDHRNTRRRPEMPVRCRRTAQHRLRWTMAPGARAADCPGPRCRKSAAPRYRSAPEAAHRSAAAGIAARAATTPRREARRSDRRSRPHRRDRSRRHRHRRPSSAR